MSRRRHVVKVAQSDTATWVKPCHLTSNVGLETFLKDKKNCVGILKKIMQTLNNY